MKVLSVIKPHHGNFHTVGALFLGFNLTNQLVGNPSIEKVGLLTKFDNYDELNSNIELYELNDYRDRRVNVDMLNKAVEVYQNNDYDVMHVHTDSLSVLRHFQKLIPESVNVVYTLHNSCLLGRSRIIYGIPYASHLNNASNYRLVAVSSDMADSWKKFCSPTDDEAKNLVVNNMSVIYNGINQYDLPLIPYDQRENKVVACSRITPSKSTLFTLKYLSDNKIPSIFIGDSYHIEDTRSKRSEHDRQYAEDCIRILKNSDNIEWIPAADNKDVLKIIGKCKVFIHMSVREGFALAPLESLYMGTPVVYSNQCSSIIEQMSKISDPDRISKRVEFKPRTRITTKYEVLRKTMDEVLQNDYDSNFIRQYYMDHFSSQKMVDKYIDLYKSFF